MPIEAAVSLPFRRFYLPDIPAEPWRNGRGTTRTVAASDPGAAARWRVSAADISEDGEFSLFPGMDRTAMLMSGSGLSLSHGDERLAFNQIGDVASFPGETLFQAHTTGPARLWNVMTARGALRAEVAMHAQGRSLDAACDFVLMVVDGVLEVSLADSPPLTLGHHCGLVSIAVSSRPLHMSMHVAAPGTRWIETLIIPA